MDEVLNYFELLWKEGLAPSLDDALRRFAEVSPGSSAAQRRDCLVELIKIDLEFRWRTGEVPTEETHAIQDGDTPIANRDGTVRALRLEHYLDSYAEIASHPDAVIDLAAEEFRVRTRWGDQPSIDEYTARFHDSGDEIRDRLRAMRRDLAADSLVVADETTDQAQAAKANTVFPQSSRPSTKLADTPKLRQLGGYALLEELGVGGMGTVYRAIQESAERTIALKVIRPDRLQSMSDRQRQAVVARFRNEAHATARLEHDHIVRIYEVGEIDGQHFFSMQLVDGPSLWTVLQDGPLAAKEAVSYVEPIARALDAAHRHGVLHRDVKPHNILIETASDRSLIADFGLAKLLDSGAELTRDGEILGTPHYMSPEQAGGKSIAETSDVYSLGATLYHMITGRPPFQSASAMAVIAQVIFDDPPPPRQLDKSLDRDIETICMKCLEKEPSRRYASAAELAADLARYRLGKPLKARPLGVVSRTWRWCKRNRAVAALLSAVAALIVVGLFGTSIGFMNATIARRASEEGFRDARLAFDDIVERIRDERALDEPQLHRLKEDLLEQALDYYQQFLGRRAGDPAIQGEVADTHFRIGLLEEELVSPDAALDSFESARAIQDKLVAKDPTDASALQALGTTLNATGKTLARKELLALAREAFAAASDVRARAVSLASNRELVVECQRQQANTHMNLGIIAKRTGEFTEALRRYEQAQSVRKSILEIAPDDELIKRDIAKGLYNIGHLQQFLGQDEKAPKSLRRAASQFESLAAADPTNVEYQLALLQCYRLLGDIEIELSVAIECYQQALAQAQMLVDDNPAVDEYQAQLAEVHTNLGQTFHDDGGFDAATNSYSAAVKILVDLKSKDLQVPSHRRNLALAYRMIAEVQIETEQLQRAAESLDKSKAELASLVEDYGAEGDRDALEETVAFIESLDGR